MEVSTMPFISFSGLVLRKVEYNKESYSLRYLSDVKQIAV